MLFVVRSELPAQSLLLIKDHEQVYAEGNGRHGSNQTWFGVSEYNPQPNPAGGEAEVHGIPHVAVETHHHQSLRGGDWGRCSASRPAEVPNAAQSDSESQHRRKRTQPSPLRRARQLHAETKRLWQQPEPQGKERAADYERGDCG